ncbi:hypothetical protein [Devosia sp. 1635]|uniref:hypothetical protein n=1 Tax=Devosia sp. 1635 TaxID=2726066 RepID=UPI001566B8EB|nr:hypothetical protein [Devosia sp. 1635]
MGRKLSESLRTRAAVIPQDINTPRTSGFIDVSGAGRVMAVVTTAAVAATKKVTVQFRQAKDATGTDAKDLGAPVEKVAGSGGGPLDLTAEATVERLDKDYGFIAVALSTDNGAAVLGSAMLLMGDNRFNP